MKSSAAAENEGDPLGTVNRLLTIGRIVWILVVLAAAGVGWGVSSLLGEGAARASFSLTLDSHERRINAAEVAIVVNLAGRIGAMEKSNSEARSDREKILDRINSIAERMSNIEGALVVIKETLKQGMK